MISVFPIPVGVLSTNCYLAYDPDRKEGFLVDPGAEAEKVLSVVRRTGVNVKAILLTHGHFDHIMAVPRILSELGVPCYIGAEEMNLAETSSLNLSYAYYDAFSLTGATPVKDLETVSVAGFTFQAIHTPGHTKGSVCYYFKEEDVLFSGDTLFLESFGNTSLPTGSMKEIMQSLSALFEALPDETAVYPGHGEPTTIGHEKQYNPVRMYGS